MGNFLKRLFNIISLSDFFCSISKYYVKTALVKLGLKNFTARELIKNPLIFLSKVQNSILEFTYFLTAITNKIIAKTNFVNLTKSISSENLVFI